MFHLAATQLSALFDFVYSEAVRDPDLRACVLVMSCPRDSTTLPRTYNSFR